MSLYSDSKEIIKDITTIAKGIRNQELSEKILDLQGLLFDLANENRDLQDEIRDLKRNEELEKEMIFREGVYVKDNEFFCNVCWDRDRRLTRVSRNGESSKGHMEFICMVCRKHVFSDIKIDELEN